jgi:hypothetical protein
MKEPVLVACRRIYRKKFFENLKKHYYLGEQCGGITLRLTVPMGLGSCSSGQVPVAGPSEDGNTHTVS